MIAEALAALGAAHLMRRLARHLVRDDVTAREPTPEQQLEQLDAEIRAHERILSRHVPPGKFRQRLVRRHGKLSDERAALTAQILPTARALGSKYGS